MNLLLLVFIAFTAFYANTGESHTQKWGQTGHYVTGEIALHFLNDGVQNRVQEVLGNTSLPFSAVWMDDVRSDHRYDYTETWHWTTIPDGMRYEDVEQEEAGDIIWALETLIEELKTGGLAPNEERAKLKFIIHMIGDIHQPLHVGNGDDRGGNDVRVQWMGQHSNLHRVWDSDIILSLDVSYTELARELLLQAGDEKVAQWQHTTVRDWAYESVAIRDQIYKLPENFRLGYEYRFANRELLFERLLQAGVRIAGVLNDIYGE